MGGRPGIDGVSRRQRRTWWATWPGALAVGLVSLVLALPGTVTLIGTALLPAEDSAAIDVQVSGPGLGLRIAAALGGGAALALPVLTLRWARKRWLGYVLLGLAASALAGAVGLGMLGIL